MTGEMIRFGECLLRWGTLAYCSMFPAVHQFYNHKIYPCPVEQKYHANGYCRVRYIHENGVHVFLPDVIGKMPMIVMVNGTGLKALHYRPVFEHLASWGFIVVGNDDSNAWSGDSALQSLEVALAMGQTPNHDLYQCIDADRLGVVGHSQGSLGAINAASKDGRFKVLYAASVPKQSLVQNLRWRCEIEHIHIPTLLVAGTKCIDQQISPLASMHALGDSITTDSPTVLGRLASVEHRFVLHEGDAYMTAWLRYWLCGDQYARTAFYGPKAELSQNPRWQDVSVKHT